jgi:hypothetical protein
VAAVAMTHGCQLEDINFSKRTINIKGPHESVRRCFVELGKLLGRIPADSKAAK